MFCPKCNTEYQQEITTCPTCQELLIEKFSDIEANLPDEIKNWIQFARINSHDLAEMFLETLRSKNIPAVIQSGTGYFGITGQIGITSYQPIGGGYSLYVPKDYLEDVDNEARIMFGEEWEQMKLVEFSK